MVKRLRTEGYTLLECLLVLTILMISTLITVPVVRKTGNRLYIRWKMDEIVMKQYEAITESQKVIYEDSENDISIYYSRLGMVRHADTLHIKNRSVILSLGTGRLYEKD